VVPVTDADPQIDVVLCYSPILSLDSASRFSPFVFFILAKAVSTKNKRKTERSSSDTFFFKGGAVELVSSVYTMVRWFAYTNQPSLKKRTSRKNTYIFFKESPGTNTTEFLL
jgi:hypothetical protein